MWPWRWFWHPSQEQVVCRYWVGQQNQNFIFLQQICMLPTASTCALELVLPTAHYNNYEDFKNFMCQGIRDHGGFGKMWHVGLQFTYYIKHCQYIQVQVNTTLHCCKRKFSEPSLIRPCPEKEIGLYSLLLCAGSQAFWQLWLVEIVIHGTSNGYFCAQQINFTCPFFCCVQRGQIREGSLQWRIQGCFQCFREGCKPLQNVRDLPLCHIIVKHHF